MRYPQFLEDNGTIGFIAPSFGCATEPYKSCFDGALKYFTEKGYSLVKGPNCQEEKGFGKSNTPEACGREVNDFFKEKKCDVIISCGGGETMCEDLPFIDFEGIKNSEPKWYMGFSDNTNLTFLLPVLCDIAAIYGPNATAFGQDALHPAVLDALDLLRGKKKVFHNYDKWEKESLKTEENPLVTYNVTEPFDIKYGAFAGEKGTEFQGRLIGGCLDVLAHICGTEFDKVKEFSERYKEDGIIWFLESCELNPFAVRCVLFQLKSAGWFKNVKGFLIGRPGLYTSEELGIAECLEEFGVPVLSDLDIGHLPPMMPLVSGAYAEVAAKGKNFTINHILK